MMLELSNGYPMPKNPVRVCYDGAVFFFYQDPGDDEKVVLADESCKPLIPWLRAAAKASDEKPPFQVRCDIPGGHYRGITKQTDAAAIWFHEPGGVYPFVQIEQGGDRVRFDADEAPYLAAILERGWRDSLGLDVLEEKLRANAFFGKSFGKKPGPVYGHPMEKASGKIPVVRPEDLVVSCPFCETSQGRLVDFPNGQNEIRCTVCGLSWSFRYTPDMTEGS